MRLQTLVSTMNQNEFDLIEKMKICSDSIVVNQCNMDSRIDFVYENFKIVWVNSNEVGLSNSRNLALKHSDGDISLIADDDLEYVKNYANNIINEFLKNPKADIIVFQVKGIEKEFKKYKPIAKKIGYLSAMKISSVEIAFRTNKVKEKMISFDPLFGAGGKYKMGEESIFLFDCLKKGLKIYYVPVEIARLHIGSSSWFHGYNEEYFQNKGAAFAAMTKVFSPILNFQFSIRKRKLYKNKFSFVEVFKNMSIGRKNYLKNKKL